MDNGYREPNLPRSPVERTSWGGRDEAIVGYKERAGDRHERVDRGDDFYRGRSPGVFLFLHFTTYLCHNVKSRLLNRLSKLFCQCCL